MKELELLQEKLQQLIKQHNTLLGDVERLKKINDKQTVIITNQQKAINEAHKELQLKSVVISASEMDTQKETLKQHLDQVIREIEKNIESL